MPGNGCRSSSPKISAKPRTGIHFRGTQELWIFHRFAMYSLAPDQLAVVERPLASHVFLRGPAGTGKSTTGAERLKYLLSNGVRADSSLS